MKGISLPISPSVTLGEGEGVKNEIDYMKWFIDGGSTAGTMVDYCF